MEGADIRGLTYVLAIYKHIDLSKLVTLNVEYAQYEYAQIHTTQPAVLR